MGPTHAYPRFPCSTVGEAPCVGSRSKRSHLGVSRATPQLPLGAPKPHVCRPTLGRSFHHCLPFPQHAGLRRGVRHGPTGGLTEARQRAAVP